MDLPRFVMVEKKINEELDKQQERESSGVSCDSCPIDSAITKLISLFRRKN
tara:strand:- start:9552 stop:9704 length:153 start_codon:yes stop_codon:yes gene_type:complete